MLVKCPSSNSADSDNTQPVIGKAAEILQFSGGTATGFGRADALLLQVYTIGPPVSPYKLPRLCAGGWNLVDPEVRLSVGVCDREHRWLIDCSQ